MDELRVPSTAPAPRTCPQCSAPVPIPEGETSARCPACGAMLRTGEGTYFGLGWRFAIAANVLLLVAIGFALLCAVNWLANKYFIRKDATFKAHYTISETSKNLLQKLADDKVKVQVYFVGGRSDGRTMEVIKHTLDLLEEYELLSNHMVKHEEASLFGNPKALLEICDKTKLKPEDIEENEVLFYCESTGKDKAVKFYELYESDYDAMQGMGGGGEDKGYKFKGEAVLTAGLQEVTEAKKTLLYFVTGHGEYSLSEFEQFGLSDFDRQLKTKENYETKELNLASQAKVPEDANAIVIVRPRTKFTNTEIDAVSRYIDGGGRVLLLFNSNREESEKELEEVDELTTLLSTWGIEVGKDYAYEGDPERTSMAVPGNIGGMELRQDTGPTVFSVADYGYHEITNKMKTVDTWFMIARSVKKAAQVPEGITVTELAKTSKESVAILDTVRKGRPPETAMKRGPISVAACAEKTIGTDKDGLKARLVVIGDADGVTNAANQQFTRNQLVTNSLRWLVGKERLISGIEPKETTDTKLNLSAADRKRVLAITVFALPGVCFLLGIASWLFRRK